METQRLILEPLEPHHADELYQPFMEKDLYNYIRRDVPQSLEWLRNVFVRLGQRVSDDGATLWLNWIPKDKNTGDCVGYLETSVNPEVTFLAYYTFKPYWGRGFAKEGVKAIMNFIDREYWPQKFKIEIDTRNRPSIRVAESLGFKWVATKNNAEFFKGCHSHEFHFEYICDSVSLEKM